MFSFVDVCSYQIELGLEQGSSLGQILVPVEIYVKC